MIAYLILVFGILCVVILLTWAGRKDYKNYQENKLKRSQIDGQIDTFRENSMDAFDEDELRRIVKDVSQYMENSPLTIAEHSRCNINRAYIWGKISMLNHMMDA